MIAFNYEKDFINRKERNSDNTIEKHKAYLVKFQTEQ